MRVDDLIDYLNKHRQKYSEIDIDAIDFDGMNFSPRGWKSSFDEIERLKALNEDLEAKLNEAESDARYYKDRHDDLQKRLTAEINRPRLGVARPI